MLMVVIATGLTSIIAWAENDSTDEGSVQVVKPAIEIIKTSEKPIYYTADEVIVFTITVKNIGESILERIVVTDPMFLDISHEMLKPGEYFEIKGNYTTTQEDIIAGKIISTASVKADSPQTPLTPTVEAKGNVTVNAQQKAPLPRTGVGSNLVLLVIGVGLIALTIVLIFKKREE